MKVLAMHRQHGINYLAEGDLDNARRAIHKGLLSASTADTVWQCYLGHLDVDEGAFDWAFTRFSASLRGCREFGNALNIPVVVEGLARLAARQAEPHRALRLEGAAAAIRAKKDQPADAFWGSTLERSPASARGELGEPATATCWEEGWAMTLHQAMAFELAGGE